ncbi:MAG: peptidoglycan-binding domain-containing protein [Pseudomonadales bacterium]|nr:peptidoglycan-binding protein [Pseudomonadales bacterium]
MKALTATLVLWIFATLPAQASDRNGEFALKGAGFLPCQVFVLEREKQSTIYYMIGGWLEGFLSAHNQYMDQTYDVTSFETLELLLGVILNHCQSNPNDRLYTVFNSILLKLQPDRIVLDSPKVEIAEGDRKTQLYRETIRRMQEKLAARGLFKEAADGRFTDATRSAIIAFQSDIEFETTGFPDQTTLWRLFRD